MSGEHAESAAADADPDCLLLRQRLAEHLTVAAEMVAIGGSVAELVLLITLTFLSEGDTMLVTGAPASEYKTAAAAVGARVRTTPLRHYRVATASVAASLPENVNLAFISNPADPSGTALSAAEVGQLVTAAQENGTLIVFDETQIDFADPEIGYTLAAIGASRPAITLRTFSRAWGLTALPVAYAVGDAALVSRLLGTRSSLPFNVSSAAQRAAMAAIGDLNFIGAIRERTAKARDRLCRGLADLGVEPVESVTNFVMVPRVRDSGVVAARLAADHGIQVRDLADSGFPGCLRVAVGEPEEMDRFCQAFAEVLASRRAPAYSAATLFNGNVGAHVVFALQDLGIWQLLAAGPVPLARLSAQVGAAPDLLRALLDVAARLGHIEIREGTVLLSRAGRELVLSRGFFTWAVGGYGALLRALPEITTGKVAWGRDVRRDEEKVASGSAQVGAELMISVETRVLAGLDFASVADIGCGDGSRLVRLCGGEPRRRGLGLDISLAACGMATGRVAAADLASLVSIRCENIFAPGNTAVFKGFDLVSSFLMLHDLFALYGDGKLVMSALRTAFPDARYFLLADTNAYPWAEHEGPLPIFSLEFELVHAFMGVKILPKETYEQAFSDSDLEIERCEPLGVPSTWLYLLRVRDSRLS
ncbi:MAG TPA: aminotransferase class I/II-fold pyridoxal phosphate-dependent enzyme [Streptosporangiaceae bacterium]|nr:aminotransferase class I/II-fold pyridoxal phosphate-dependent enzyme [Streptosporangiaceae bacterium]